MSANTRASEHTSPVPIGEVWPVVRADLVRALAARQVPRPDAEDIVQEVAVRALEHPDGFATQRDLARWSWRVAWHLRIDAARKNTRLTAVPCPEVAARDDTAVLVEGRLALEATLSGLTRLSASDRAALLEPPEATASRQESVRLAVRRHRARARLTRLVGGLPAGWLGLGGARRRVRLLRPRTHIAITAAPVAVLVASQLGVVMLGLPLREPSESSTPRLSPSVTYSDATIVPATVRPLTAPVHVSRRDGPTAAPPATVAAVPVGPSLRVVVTRDDRPDPPTLCMRNVAAVDQVCIDRPGPPLPVLAAPG
jgi:DNA-directed RNA polymerase specialized sigma24 family protein